MSQFLGTHLNRLDAKGRVSIPAPFRAALRDRDDAPVKMVLRPSHKHPCIEGWPVATFEALATPLQELDDFSDEHDDLAVTLYADAFPVEADKEGRILLAQDLASHAGLTDSVTFMGAGRIFQIWQPAQADARRKQAIEQVRLRKTVLPGRKAA